MSRRASDREMIATLVAPGWDSTPFCIPRLSCPASYHPLVANHGPRGRLDASLASAFRTSAWDNPNCRAICDGLTPALKAARTAFIFPGVK